MLWKSSKHHSYKKTFSAAESFIPKSHFMRRRAHGIPGLNGPPNNLQTETFSTIQKKWTPRFSCWLSVLFLSTLCVVFLSNPGNNFGNMKVPKWTLLIGNRRNTTCYHYLIFLYSSKICRYHDQNFIFHEKLEFRNVISTLLSFSHLAIYLYSTYFWVNNFVGEMQKTAYLNPI